jgi:hypothetical protein
LIKVLREISALFSYKLLRPALVAPSDSPKAKDRLEFFVEKKQKKADMYKKYISAF